MTTLFLRMGCLGVMNRVVASLGVELSPNTDVVALLAEYRVEKDMRGSVPRLGW